MPEDLDVLRKKYFEKEKTNVPRPWHFDEEDLEKLLDLQRWLGCSRAEVVRTAVRHMLAGLDV